MAELLATEKLHPCLLDRLTDSAPENPLESRAERVMSMARYKESVLRDIRWLLTTTRPSIEHFFEEFPEIVTSVLNYGARSLCGQVSASLDMEEVQRDMRNTLMAFEPRINPDSVSVQGNRDYWSQATNELNFDIRGDLWARPMAEELFIKTILDLETGGCQIQESRAT